MKCVDGVENACTPGEPSEEVCDGKDNDCDGLTDEDLEQACTITNEFGTCSGTETCRQASWVGCTAKTPAAEICNNIDDDCDGLTDENLSQPCTITNNFGTCTGIETCVDGNWVGCAGNIPTAEICNNIDDDCDGLTDEDLEQACTITNEFGTCNGIETCSEGNWQRCSAKTPAAEICNNIDDDCDGETDEELSRACSVTNRFGTCTGTETCSEGNWVECTAKTPATETCNNIDDDCDGFTDEGLSQACSVTNAFGTCTGRETCAAGRWLGCTAKTPVAEICNNIDDDCDGTTDEDLTQACLVTNDFGTCSGTETCRAGNWVECNAKTPAPENCNNVDDDCDGLTDEDLSRMCTVSNSFGTCVGTESCSAGNWVGCNAKTPTEETCNNIDDDCDGLTDEDLSEQACSITNSYGTCTGTQTCRAGAWVDCTAKTPAEETCNNIDDDCDGLTDEGLSRTCTVTNSFGTCTGIETCSNGNWVGCTAKTPTAEICNNIDDNCDGRVDEDLSRACSITNGFGTCNGTETCNAGNWEGCNAKTPAAETCNNIDDDCDGLTDEGLSQACSITNAFGTCNGTETCSAGSWVGCNAKTPAAETCNNIDDNCDGRVDEDLSQACSVTNAHGTCTGTETCSAGNWVGCNAKTPVAETCNNIDDNCDGRVDEDLSRACSITNGFGTCNGTETCNAGNWEGCNAKTPAAETCNNIDDDCDGLTDEGLSQACSITNAFGTCNGTETCNAGNWVGCNAKTPIAEICNNIDDDCDGSTDENLLQACSVTNVHGTCTGTEMCNAGNWVGCTAKTPAAEICNNIDDNCDGLTDEGLGTTTCGLGVCHHTVQNCVNGVPQVCNPFHGRTTEVCDGLDNDCDGYTDEDLGTTTCGLGICHHTVQNCVNGVPQHCDPLEGRMIEVCDGYDNDCDGYTDEDLGTTTCGLGECRHTAPNCLNGVPQTCDPYLGMSPEICDGLDNDCDGDTDENLLNCQVLWVDQSNIGDPDENGSRLHPFTTIGKALAVSQDGTVIRVLEGTYPGGLTVEHPNIRIIGSGTDNTFVSSVAGATGFYVTGDNVTIQDMKVSGGRYGVVFQEVTGGTLQNLTIASLIGPQLEEAAGVKIDSATSLSLSGLTISGVTGGNGSNTCSTCHGKRAFAVEVINSSGINISDGIFSGIVGGNGRDIRSCTPDPMGGNVYGVRLQDSTDIIVQNTIIFNLFGGKGARDTYYNYAGGKGGLAFGLSVSTSNNVRLFGNLVYDVVGGPTYTGAASTYNTSSCVQAYRAESLLVDRVTCVGSGQVAQRGFWSDTEATMPIGVTNSIFAHLSDYCLWNDPSNDSGALTVSYSNMFDCQAGVQSNANVMSNCLTSDPMFVNDDITAPDYHLLPSSPSIDTGKPNSDYCNEPYPNGCRVNMGAYGNTAEATSAQGAENCFCEDGPDAMEYTLYDDVRVLPANATVTQLGPETCDNILIEMNVTDPVAGINVGDVVVYSDAENGFACRVNSVGTEPFSVFPTPIEFSPNFQSNSTQALPKGPIAFIVSGVRVLLDDVFRDLYYAKDWPISHYWTIGETLTLNTGPLVVSLNGGNTDLKAMARLVLERRDGITKHVSLRFKGQTNTLLEGSIQATSPSVGPRKTKNIKEFKLFTFWVGPVPFTFDLGLNFIVSGTANGAGGLTYSINRQVTTIAGISRTETTPWTPTFSVEPGAASSPSITSTKEVELTGKVALGFYLDARAFSFSGPFVEIRPGLTAGLHIGDPSYLFVDRCVEVALGGRAKFFGAFEKGDRDFVSAERCSTAYQRPVCFSGECCSGIDLKPAGTTCGSPDYQYVCSGGTDCGSSVYRQKRYKTCTGMNASCSGEWTTFEDDGIATTCSPTQKCVAGQSTCETCSICTPNAKRCSGGTLYTCNSSGTAETSEQCPTGVCQNGACIACSNNFCQNNGYSSGTYCDGQSKVTCGTQGSCKVETARSACGNGTVCQVGDCVTCGGDGQPCCLGNTCNSGYSCSGGTCQTCAWNFCQNNGYSSGTYCDGNQRVTCGTSGACKVESNRSSCSGSTPYCTGSDTCVQCTQNGHCSVGQSCVENVCTTTTCPSNFCQDRGYSSGTYCDGNQRVTCGLSGSCRVETNRTSCGTYETCSSGSCICGNCPSGYQCCNSWTPPSDYSYGKCVLTTPPSPPILHDPSSGVIRSPGNITFSWGPVYLAGRYALAICKTSNLQDCVAIIEPQNGVTQATRNLPAGTYWWSVRSIRPCDIGGWSAYRSPANKLIVQ